MADDRMQRFMGGSPLSTLIKLALLCLLVGALLAAFGMTPWRFFEFLRYSFREILGTGMEAVHKIGDYIAAGAIIVLPIWLLMRLLRRKS